MARLRKPRSRAQRIVLFAVAVAALFGGYYWGSLYAPKVSTHQVLRPLERPVPLQPFELLDRNGQPFTLERLQGRWSLLFSGSTTSDQATRDLLTLGTRVLNRLAQWPELQSRTRIVFLSLDPDRDTPERLSRFFGGYGADFIALTGEMEQIRQLAQQIGVTFKRVEGTEPGDYRIDHSTSIALVDPDARVVGLFTGLVDAASIAADIRQQADMGEDR
ncbi:MAG TPA: SCO family protein [Sedimenticola thiotaurini]|uniref:SCO family protein n=1 Tax=Sedimenticola thiotaurini TaxID=1543721 RepID=A0A831RPU9_9GAMM|nr:SCO family protein [Sedimenticola thiotaurini]